MTCSKAQGHSGNALPGNRSAVGVGWVCLVWIAFFQLAGCTPENYGRFVPDPDVARLFASAGYDPDYAYYASGFNTYTWAVLGLLPKYQVAGEHWKPIDPESSEFRELVTRMAGSRGAVIRTPSGIQIGVWYARQEKTTLTIDTNDRITAGLLHPPLGGR